MGKWSKDCIQLIIDRYPLEGASKLAKELVKSTGSIYQVARRLGLKYEDNWTEDHLNILKKRYISDGPCALEIELGRSNKVIAQKAFQLGLSKEKPRWTDEEEKIIIEKYKELGPKKLSNIINKSPATITAKAKKLGLTVEFKRWTDEEDKMLLENYSTLGPKECSILLNRSFYSITKRSGYLGLKITRKWNLLSPQELIDLYNSTDMSIQDISHLYETEVWIIRKSFEKAGIKFQSKPTVRGSKSKNWTGYEGISGSYFSNIKKSARERSIEFNITIEYIWNLLINQNKKCALSGVDIDIFLTNYRRKDVENCKASLDRIDSSKGYVEGNVQWVHKTVNHMKMALSETEFINWCNLISEKNKC